MKQEKTVNVTLSTEDLIDAVKTYVTTPRVRRHHKLPRVDRESVDVSLVTNGEGQVEVDAQLVVKPEHDSPPAPKAGTTSGKAKEAAE